MTETLRLAAWIYNLVLDVVPGTKRPNWDGWERTLDLMIRIDKHTTKQIATVFKWANEDDFWCDNILSPKKLREKWPKLQKKMGKGSTKTPKLVLAGAHKPWTPPENIIGTTNSAQYKAFKAGLAELTANMKV